MSKLFTYGTLKAGFPNHHVLGTSRLLGKAWLPEADLIHLGGFPGLLLWTSDNCVAGEVWEIDEETQKRCDILEGYPYLYGGMYCDVYYCPSCPSSHREEDVWVYIYNRVHFNGKAYFINPSDDGIVEWKRNPQRSETTLRSVELL